MLEHICMNLPVTTPLLEPSRKNAAKPSISTGLRPLTSRESIIGIITMREELVMTHDDFWHRFIRFEENQGWTFMGITDDVTDKKE